MLDAALQSAERARVLVGRLLSFARRQHLEMRPVRIDELVSGISDLMARSIGPNIELIFDVTERGLVSRVDPNQLELALLNLGVNARDAMPAGGKLRITVAATEVGQRSATGLGHGRYVCIAVADTGTGMDKETLSRATEPFFTTKGIGRGTGLGLSMVHGLAMQSGGTLALDSTPGRGTTATIYLPVDPDSLVEGRGETEPEIKSAKITILLVDDEDLVRSALVGMMEDMGHRVIAMPSATAALRQLGVEPEIDLLITDQIMPTMNGLELIREARRLRPGLRALVITGYAGTDPLSGDEVPKIGKPLREKELATAIATVMGEHSVVPILRTVRS
jgi:CheY-like chemotaxis protein